MRALLLNLDLNQNYASIISYNLYTKVQKYSLEVFCKKGVLRNVAKFIQICGISKNTFFAEHPPKPASENRPSKLVMRITEKCPKIDHLPLLLQCFRC